MVLVNFCFDSKYRNTIWNKVYLAVFEFSNDNVNLKIIPYTQCDDKLGIFRVKEEADFVKTIHNSRQGSVDA